ncbi:MAG: DUF899 domain-containing protein [Opitutae bacterium]|nr:DUF899 domain-containing protein [Opitutae bacterium]
MKNSSATISPRIVPRADWLAARRVLLQREKELTHLRDAVSAERRTLPWVKIDSPYVFAGPHGVATLADLFGDRTQLVVYHFMFGPGWEEGCQSCSMLMDHIGGLLPHLRARSTALAAVSRATWPEIEAFQRRMGWSVPWVSSHGNDFNRDFQVSFTRDDMDAGRVTYNFETLPPGPLPVEELPGISVFARDRDGQIFHTYSTYARGCDPMLGIYQWLDLTPKGRDEDDLAHPMAWVRHHDRYDADYRVDPAAPYQPPRGAISRPCCSGAGT